jgi:hypothetical protein
MVDTGELWRGYVIAWRAMGKVDGPRHHMEALVADLRTRKNIRTAGEAQLYFNK